MAMALHRGRQSALPGRSAAQTPLQRRSARLRRWFPSAFPNLIHDRTTMSGRSFLRMHSIRKFGAAGLLIAGALVAQNPGVKRDVVQRKDISVPGREAVIAHVTIEPGASAGRHTHPGEEITYVMHGNADILI